ncbi:FXYD domain-containing ion transport regulator 6-like isoform X2 [Bombina bombina]|nr:FXYD domain-containing ion transport regulator 6-like isoform X2 [Bombina bombina]
MITQNTFVLVLLSLAGCAGTSVTSDKFYYDYNSLRIGGLVFAGCMLAIGVGVFLSDFKFFKSRKLAPATLQQNITH